MIKKKSIHGEFRTDLSMIPDFTAIIENTLKNRSDLPFRILDIFLQ